MGCVVRHQRQIVADHDLRKAALVPGGIQQFPKEPLAAHVYACRRLVQHQQFRITAKSRSQQHTAQFAARKVTHAALLQMLGLDHLQKLPPLAARPRAQAQPQGLALAAQGQKFAHAQGQAAIHNQMLRHIGHAGLML